MQFVGRVTTSQIHQDAIKKLTLKEKQILFDKLSLELSRSRIANTFDSRSVSFYTRTSINNLTELSFFERLDAVEFAMESAIVTIRLFIDANM